MRTGTILAAGTLMILAANSRAEARQKRRPAITVKVGTGSTQSVRVGQAIKNVHVLNPRVAEVVQATKRGVTIVGVSAGTTEVLVHLSQGGTQRIVVRVSQAATTRLYEAVKRYLGPAPGIILHMIGDKVIVEGRAATLAVYGRIVRAQRIFGKKKVINFAGYQPSAVKELNRILRRAGLAHVHASQHGRRLFLEGGVSSSAQRAKAQAIVRGVGLRFGSSTRPRR